MKTFTITLFMMFFLLIHKFYCSIVCRMCKNNISHIESIMEVKSHVAISEKRKRIFNKNDVLSQVFINPHNVYFEVITTSQVTNLYCDESKYTSETFFLGYAWSSCVCLFCGEHHGWKFTPEKNHCSNIIEEEKKYVCMGRKVFYGLVTSHLESGHLREVKIEL